MLSTRTCDTGRQMFGTIAYCRGVVVAIRKFSVSSIDLNKKNLLELKQVLYVICNSFHFQICKLKMVYNGEPIDYYTYYIRGPEKRNRLTHTFHYLMHQNLFFPLRCKLSFHLMKTKKMSPYCFVIT